MAPNMHSLVAFKLAAVAVCMALPAFATTEVCRGPRRSENPTGAICATVGYRIVGDTVFGLLAAFWECVDACRERPECTAANHWGDNGTCQLVHAVDNPVTPHPVENAEGCLGVYLKPRCFVTTQPHDPMEYTFGLPEQTVPFRVQFSVRADESAIIALAAGRRYADIFCHITLGGWGDTKATIRTGDLQDHNETGVIIQDEFFIKDHLSSKEYHPFWIGYANGLLKVGNCSHSGALAGTGACNCVPFLQWNVETALRVTHSKVNIGISTWRFNSGDWEFEQFCNRTYPIKP